MTERVGSAGAMPACFDDTLERLDAASATLERVEEEVSSRLRTALVSTVKTAALCIGGTRLESGSCIVAAAQHLETLWSLEQLSARYERAVADYEAALGAHVACLRKLE